jgi:predicted Zn-dependent protease
MVKIVLAVFHPELQILAEKLRPMLEEAFAMSVEVLPHQLHVPQDAFYPHRGQFLASSLIREVAVLEGEAMLLGITEHDLFSTGLSFVFGQASSGDHAAVFSTAR